MKEWPVCLHSEYEQFTPEHVSAFISPLESSVTLPCLRRYSDWDVSCSPTFDGCLWATTPLQSYCPQSWTWYNAASLNLGTKSRFFVTKYFSAASIKSPQQAPRAKVSIPGGLPHRICILLPNSSLPFCCLPNDQLNGLPRGCLSQRQLENCWGNILFYWKWFPSNCHEPYLDPRLSNTQPKGLSLQDRRPWAVRKKEFAFVWPQWPQGMNEESVGSVTSRIETLHSVWKQRLPFLRWSLLPCCPSGC